AGSTVCEGAAGSPVTTGANGFEKVDTADPATVKTNAEGEASITFTTPGWHRIKATVPGAREEEAIRSNRLDVCVLGPGETSCEAPPAEDAVRVPPPTPEEETSGEEPGGEGDEETTGGSGELPGGEPPPVFTLPTGNGGGGSGSQASASKAGAPSTTPAPAAKAGPVRVSTPKLDRGKLRRGRLGVSWTVLGSGAAVK